MPIRSAKQPKALPADLTSFVGRRSEITAVRRLLSKSRLVTLTGVGGVGKTRLALRVAGEVVRAFPDGVCLVELASLKDPALLPHTVIDALGISEQSTRAPMTVLANYLGPRQILLLLDNCEHLLEAAADLADQLLRAAPDLRILATSRQALMIAGEYVYPVPPLPVPDLETPSDQGRSTEYPALMLLADRADAVVPGFTITPDNVATVSRLCQRLEGIPLAIELAAVRLRVLTVDDLANRLDDRFQLLREGSRTAPERHQTLQALIDWSHQLCTPREQTLWARASVFAGGFDLHALDAVCTDHDLPAEAVLDTVAGLADKSIFIREEHAGHTRFRMLETIREYGHGRLHESGTEPALRRRHRDWCLRLVEQAAAGWFGPKQEDWASRLHLQHANLRVALEYCLSQPGERRTALRMAGLPWFLWFALGFMTEGRLWLDRALELEREPSHERAWALTTNAYIAIFQGDEASGTALLEEAGTIAAELDDPAALAYVTHLLGMRQFLTVDLAGAIPRFLEALERYAATDVPEDYPTSVRLQMTVANLLLGELDKATELIEEVYRRCERAGERWLLSYALWGRGFLELARGDLDDADADLCEALKIKRTFRDSLGLAFTLDAMAWVAIAQGDCERAATLLGGANSLWHTIGAPLFGSTHLLARRERYEAAARKTIGDTAFEAASARGRGFTAEQMLAFAVRETDRSTTPSSPQATTKLTRREREVAELVAGGMSNREVAAKLVISPRTAEAHVEHILTKLGFNSRAQIASWVTGQRAGRAEA